MPRPQGASGRQVAAEYSDEELLDQFRSGDDAALAELFDRYRWLVRSKARCYFLVGAEFDDVEQEGLIGLFKAVRDFRSSHQVSFRCFAELCVTRQILSAIRSATRSKHRPLNFYVSLSCPPPSGDDQGSAEAWVEAILDDQRAPDPAVELISRDDLRRLRCSIVESLSELEVRVLGLYLEGFTYSEISSTLDRPVKVVDNALQRIKRKLERRLWKPEEYGAEPDSSGRCDLAPAV